MAVVTICSDFGAQENSLSLLPLFPHLFPMKWWDRMPWSSFFECWVLSQLFHSPLSLIFHYINVAAAAAAKLLQSCPTLCDPIDGSPPGSAIPGILQARILEWVAISFSNAWKWKVKLLSRVRLLATPWTAAYQAPPSMGFSRQEYWSGVPLPSPETYVNFFLLTCDNIHFYRLCRIEDNFC